MNKKSIARVAVVEDDELISTMIKVNLERDGYEVFSTDNAEKLLSVIENEYFDLIILDIMLPGLSGEDCLVRIRNRDINTPVLMLTAKQDDQSKEFSFRAGADDYITKPFSIKELMLRINALIRRSQSEAEIPSKQKYRFNGFSINFLSRKAITNQGEIILTEKEVNTLKLFIRNSGKNISRADIIENAWGMDVYPTQRVVDNMILRLRKLFEKDISNPVHFITVHSYGYRFEA